MKLPPRLESTWILKLSRTIAPIPFAIALIIVLGCLAVGLFKQAAVFTVSVVVFGVFWVSLRQITLRLEKWSRRAEKRVKQDRTYG